MKRTMLLLVLAVLGGCGDRSRQEPTGTRQPTAEAPSAHWVQSEQLQGLMDRLAARRWSATGTSDKDVESPAGADEDTRRVSALAAELAAMATNIPTSVNLSSLSASDRAAFIAEADNLHDEAMNLQRAADRKQIERMQGAMKAIDGTCLACHSRFRDLTGVLDRNRAELRAPGLVQSAVAASSRR